MNISLNSFLAVEAGPLKPFHCPGVKLLIMGLVSIFHCGDVVFGTCRPRFLFFSSHITKGFLCVSTESLEQPIIAPAACLQEIAQGCEGITVAFTWVTPPSLLPRLSVCPSPSLALLTKTKNPADACRDYVVCVFVCLWLLQLCQSYKSLTFKRNKALFKITFSPSHQI